MKYSLGRSECRLSADTALLGTPPFMALLAPLPRLRPRPERGGGSEDGVDAAAAVVAAAVDSPAAAVDGVVDGVVDDSGAAAGAAEVGVLAPGVCSSPSCFLQILKE